MDNAINQLIRQFFTKDMLLEPIQTIAEQVSNKYSIIENICIIKCEWLQYPQWLEENEQKLTDEEKECRRNQCKLYKKAWKYLNCDQPDMDKVLNIITEVSMCF